MIDWKAFKEPAVLTATGQLVLFMSIGGFLLPSYAWVRLMQMIFAFVGITGTMIYLLRKLITK